MAESECSCPEIGPIRPPSEATSLLVRVTRNCPWNRCTFCPVYKNERFSLRSVEDVKADVQAMASAAEAVRQLSWRMGESGEMTGRVARAVLQHAGSEAFQVALFLQDGGRSVSLQDGGRSVTP